MQNFEKVAEMKLKLDEMEQYSRRTGGKYRQCYYQHSKKGRRWVSWKTFHNPITEYILLCHIKETLFVLI